MARILLLDGDACLWNSVCDILEGEGYTVCRAHNDYEGLPVRPHRVHGPDTRHRPVYRGLLTCMTTPSVWLSFGLLTRF
jgi:hypothetical protein